MSHARKMCLCAFVSRYQSFEMARDIARFVIISIASTTIDITSIKDARRSRTRARSESSTSPTHRPAIESSSSSKLCASSMMEHVDDDLVAT